MAEENKKNIENPSKQDVEMQIIDVLKTVYDPEIPVDVYEMGLIYEINIDDDFIAESLPEEVRQKTEGLWSVKSAKVTLAWEPPWTKDMMSEEAKFELGFM